VLLKRTIRPARTSPRRPAIKQRYTQNPKAGFKTHPNESPKLTVEFLIDFEKVVPHVISFAEELNLKTDWHNEDFIIWAMQRYHKFMYLKKKFPEQMLVPTADIEMIWKSHLLRPASYVQYCIKYFGSLIDHTVIGSELENELLQPGLEQTIKIWNEEYQERYLIPEKTSTRKFSWIDIHRTVHPSQGPIYYDDLQHVSETYKLSPKNKWENILSISPSEVQGDIYWIRLFHLSFMGTGDVLFDDDGKMKFCDPRRIEDSAIYRLTKSYERFLYLVAQNHLFFGESEKLPFCLSNAVDVIRHCHMLHPKIYNDECKKLVHYVPNYGSINNSPSVKYLAWSNALWKAEYEVPMDRDHEYQASIIEQPIVMDRFSSRMTLK